MNYQSLVTFSENLHVLVESNQDFFGPEIEQFKRLNGIDKPQDFAREYQRQQDEDRLMSIGIVGRVKAGKSSLLNALVFNGEPILPKAATPMTAALTTITWGEVFQAKVEFYSETDIAKIGLKSAQFEERLVKRKRECLEEELTKRRRAQAHGADVQLDRAELTKMADKKAWRELQCEEGLFAAHDQFQRMKESGLDASTLHLHSEIQAGSPKELADRLHDYVGADGSYMPFTKTVDIYMPLETLRDIRIIDTPGMNDPVQSREERTVELLKTCDVVFIVSPAGQFLNEQDLEVMGRITQKEGIQELVLIASQIDTQLYGSEKRARLSDAVEAIRTQLSARAQSVLNGLKMNSPEVGSVFDNLIGSVHRNLLHSSGLCHSLNRRFDTPENWDSNEKQTWENLVADYPDYFSRNNKTLSLNSLDSLANINAVNAMLAQVREKKSEIVRERIAKWMIDKQKNLEAFKALIINLAHNQISQIKNANTDRLDEQLASLQSKRLDLSLELDTSFKYTMVVYRQKLCEDMRKAADNLLRETQSKVSGASGSYSETVVVKKSGIFNDIARFLWDGGTTQETRVRPQIISSQVISAIEKFIDNIQNALRDQVESSRPLLDIELGRTLTPKVREVLEKDANAQIIKRAIVSIVNAIPDNDFDLRISLPDTLKNSGTLKGYEAERFKNAAEDFIGSLDSPVNRKINSFISDVESNTPSTISDSFADDVERQINALKKQVDDSAQTIGRLERLVRKAEGVTL